MALGGKLDLAVLPEGRSGGEGVLLEPEVRGQANRRHPLLLEEGQERPHLLGAPLRLLCGRAELLAVQRDIVAAQLRREAVCAVPAHEPVYPRLGGGAGPPLPRRPRAPGRLPKRGPTTPG